MDLFLSNIEKVSQLILYDKLDELVAFLRTHSDLNLRAYPGTFSTPLYMSLSHNRPEYIVPLLETGASMHFSTRKFQAGKDSIFDYCMERGDEFGVPLFLFHEEELLPSQEELMKIKRNIKRIPYKEQQEKTLRIFNATLPSAKAYRGHLAQAHTLEENNDWLNAISHYQSAIKLLIEQRDHSQSVPYPRNKKRPVRREVFYQHYCRKIAKHQARILHCFMQMPADELLVDDKQLAEWIDSVAGYPGMTLQGYIDAQFPVITKASIQLLDRWGKLAATQSKTVLAERCFRCVGDLYVSWSERLTGRPEGQRYLQHGAQYYGLADSFLPDSPRSDSTTKAYQALRALWQQQGCVSSVRAIDALLSTHTQGSPPIVDTSSTTTFVI